MPRNNKPAVGRINPETGELEFQGSNRVWIPSGVRFEEKGSGTPPTQSSKISAPVLVKTRSVKTELTEEERMQKAMMDMCVLRGASE